MTASTGKNPAQARRQKVARTAVAAIPGGEITAEITLEDGRVISLDGTPEELRAVAHQLVEVLAAVTKERDQAREELAEVTAVVAAAEAPAVVAAADQAAPAAPAPLPARVGRIVEQRDEALRERDRLAEIVGQAIAATLLEPGERLARPSEHALVVGIVRLLDARDDAQRRVVDVTAQRDEAQLERERQRARAVKAEGERDLRDQYVESLRTGVAQRDNQLERVGEKLTAMERERDQARAEAARRRRTCDAVRAALDAADGAA